MRLRIHRAAAIRSRRRHDQRTDRRAQALGEADRHRVEESAVRRERHPVGDVGVPDPGAVAVQRNPGGVGHPAQRAQRRQRDDRTAGAVVGLLDGDGPGRHGEEPVRPDHRGDLLGVDVAPDRRPGPGRDAADGGRRADLVGHDVRVGVTQQFLRRRHEQLDRDLVRHRAGRA